MEKTLMLGKVEGVEKAREFQKNFYFCFIDYAKAFDCVYHGTGVGAHSFSEPIHHYPHILVQIHLFYRLLA